MTLNKLLGKLLQKLIVTNKMHISSLNEVEKWHPYYHGNVANLCFELCVFVFFVKSII